MYQITLQAMRFDARVGILPHERLTPQPIEIDVTLGVSRGDGIVDYRKLYDLVLAIMSAGPIDYLEQIGDRIATAALGLSERIHWVRVATRKPRVSLPGPLDYAEVVVERNAASSPDA